MKKVLNISLWVVVLGGIFTLLGFVDKEQKSVRCNGLSINIDHSSGNFFISDEDVRTTIRNLGFNVDKQSICEIDLQSIEAALNHNPVVKNADVYCSINGEVSIDIEQRKPLLRVFSQNGESYYIDVEGNLMPLSRKYTSRVLVANGNINEPYALRYHTNMASLKSFQEQKNTKCILHDLYALSRYINESEFWNSQITQVYVNDKGDIELIPRVGNHTLVIGDTTDLEEKFEKLLQFYKKGLTKTGWNEYKTINLKYKNQVVCTKK